MPPKALLPNTDWADYSPWAKSGLTPIFVNKVVEEYSHVHSYMYCLGLLSPYSDS